MPVSQMFGDKQALASLHDMRQSDVPSQRKRPQSLVVPGAQVPAPSQKRADVAVDVPAGQVASWHWVVLP